MNSLGPNGTDSKPGVAYRQKYTGLKNYWIWFC